VELARVTKGSIKSIKPCSEPEFDAYKLHIDNILDAGRTIDLFEILQSARADYFEHVASAVGMHLSSGDMVNPYSMDKFSIDTSRYFLNYLTAMRVFLDHAEARLKKKFGRNSVEDERFKAVAAAEFDGKFSNRLFYKLRNYTQHCGMPPVGFNIVHKIGEGVEVVFTLDKEALLKNYSEWGAIVKADLLGLEDDPKLFELINDHFQSMYVVYLEVFRIMHLDQLPESLHWVCTFLDDPRPEDTYAFLVDIQRNETGNGIGFGLRWVPSPVIRNALDVVDSCQDTP
jgi:hypothetical protein